MSAHPLTYSRSLAIWSASLFTNSVVAVAMFPSFRVRELTAISISELVCDSAYYLNSENAFSVHHERLAQTDVVALARLGASK